MKGNRRKFIGLLGGLFTCSAASASTPMGTWHSKAPAEAFGCLVDLSVCIGCRKCEQVCNTVNSLPLSRQSFGNRLILDTKRRPDVNAFTVVNRYYSGKTDKQNSLLPTFVKVQCMHCQDPACVSACLAGALTKKENGAVHYDKTKCIGCRYCMVACPFQIPAYEYKDPITPRVRKCTFCFERIRKEGGKPACASICPMETITFGKRKDILRLAQKKISENPAAYEDRIYGREEVGGTSWMYISDVPFEKVGFVKLPSTAMPALPETIQHSLFTYLWSPLALFSALGAVMWFTNRGKDNAHSTPSEESNS